TGALVVRGDARARGRERAGARRADAARRAADDDALAAQAAVHVTSLPREQLLDPCGRHEPGAAGPAVRDVVGVEEPTTPELCARVAELAAQAQSHVAPVGEAQKMQPRLDAVDSQAGVDVLEVRAGGHSAGEHP